MTSLVKRVPPLLPIFDSAPSGVPYQEPQGNFAKRFSLSTATPNRRKRVAARSERAIRKLKVASEPRYLRVVAYCLRMSWLWPERGTSRTS
jgi:hypothetical protein